MKRLLQLLITFSAVLTVSVSAREIDLQGRIFNEGELYYTSDILKNVNVKGRDRYYFYNPFGRLEYSISYYDDSPIYSKVGTVSTMASKFYAYNDYPTAFKGINDGETDFVIPNYYGDNIYWMTERYPYEPFSNEICEDGKPINEKTSVVAQRPINFYPGMTKPELKVECDDESINAGETTHCRLMFTVGNYPETYLDYSTFNIYLNLSSEDYEITNIKTGKYSKVAIDNNKVSGQVFDMEKIIYNINKYELNSPSKIEGYFNGEYTRKQVCLDYHMLKEQIKLADYSNYGDEVSACYGRFDDTILVLSFDITSNGNGSEGLIKLSDVQIVIDSDESSIDPIVVYENEEEETTVPIIGLVKGVEEVEENPKTGLFNYIMLIIPAILFIYGLFLLKKRTSFKGI